MTDQRRFVFGSAVFGLVFFATGGAPARAGFCSFCGDNAATLEDGLVFTEVKLAPPLRLEGPTITGVRSADVGGVPVTLSVEGDKLSAFTKGGASTSVPLAGIVISLAMRDGRAYEVIVDRVLAPETMTFWAAPQTPVPAYVFKVKKVAQRKDAPVVPKGMDPKYKLGDIPPETDFVRHLCTGKFMEPTVNDREGQEHAGLIFAGDHYNSDDHTVSKQAKGLFNLACFGTATAKMHLLRHTTAGIAPSGSGMQPTSLDERTAMLRAITADYCGDGRSWTADGTPLWWTDARQSFPLSAQPKYPTGKPISFANSVEAVWGRRGKLLCLNEPRRTAATVDPETCTAPAVPREVVTNGAVACRGGRRIPRCSDFPWDNKGNSPWLEPPLRPATTPADKRMLDAYVVTVNRGEKANYCNKPATDPISWPRR